MTALTVQNVFKIYQETNEGQKTQCAVVEYTVACCRGSQGVERQNSPWSFNGKTSRPKEVGSSRKWVGEGEEVRDTEIDGKTIIKLAHLSKHTFYITYFLTCLLGDMRQET